jgi:hypothetical protein
MSDWLSACATCAKILRPCPWPAARPSRARGSARRVDRRLACAGTHVPLAEHVAGEDETDGIARLRLVEHDGRLSDVPDVGAMHCDVPVRMDPIADFDGDDTAGPEARAHGWHRRRAESEPRG